MKKQGNPDLKRCGKPPGMLSINSWPMIQVQDSGTVWLIWIQGSENHHSLEPWIAFSVPFFAPDEAFDLDKVVLNTEAHPFLREKK